MARRRSLAPTAMITNQDCIRGMAEMKAGSVHLVVSSIPFESLFIYSGKEEDVGNNGSTVDIRAGRFALNMRFVAEQMFRVLATGCNFCCHIQQLLAYKNQHGFSGRRDFRGAMVDVFGAAGFQWKGEVAIPKDPQALANKLNLHSLQFKTGHSRSSTDWAMAPNDYVLIFQKPGPIAVPVRPLVYKAGKRPLSRAEWFELHGINDAGYVEYLRTWAEDVKAINPGGWISMWDWIIWASGDWPDILEIDVLSGASGRQLDRFKEEKTESHVCPLQLEVIRRFVLLYTNPIEIQPDVTVLDPFMGIGSTAWVCLGARSPHTKFAVTGLRNVVGFELKESYYKGALANVAKARRSVQESTGQVERTLQDYAEAAAV